MKINLKADGDTFELMLMPSLSSSSHTPPNPSKYSWDTPYDLRTV